MSWSPHSATSRYTVYWRVAGTYTWTTRNIGPVDHVQVGQLLNGVLYDFSIEDMGARRQASNIVELAPKNRRSCSFPDYLPFQGLFCSYADADAWLRLNNVSPSSLRCRGKHEPWNPDSRDCLYVLPNGLQFFLLRNADNAIQLAIDPSDIASLRAAAQAAVWHGGDPFEKTPASDPGTALTADTGQVTRYV